MLHRPFALASVLLLAASGCSIPGVETTRIDSEALVQINGQLCEYVSRAHETPTVNGMSRYYTSSITCGRQTFECGDISADACADKVAATLPSQ
jgi:hypothetical protein